MRRSRAHFASLAGRSASCFSDTANKVSRKELENARLDYQLIDGLTEYQQLSQRVQKPILKALESGPLAAVATQLADVNQVVSSVVSATQDALDNPVVDPEVRLLFPAHCRTSATCLCASRFVSAQIFDLLISNVTDLLHAEVAVESK